MLDTLKGMRRSDLVIKMALVVNAIFTFIFGYRYLPDLFKMFGVSESDLGYEIMRVAAGAFLVVVTDGAFFAWAEMRNRDGNTNEQIITCDEAKKWSLVGSLAATAGAFVLGQSAVAIPEGIMFTISLVATAVAGLMAIAHVYWYDQYKSDSLEARSRSDAAESQAEELAAIRRQQRERLKLERQKAAELHAIELQELDKQLELEKAQRLAEAEIEIDLLEAGISHQREVAAVTKKLLGERVNRDAAVLAQRNADKAMEKLIATLGLPVTDFTHGSNGNGNGR